MDDQTVTCPQCERELDDSLTWCPACGAELKPGRAAAYDDAVSGIEAIPEEEPLLPGDLVPADRTRRASPPLPEPSGDPFATAGEPDTIPFPSARRSSTAPLMILVGLLLLAGLGLAVFFVAGSSDDGDVGEIVEQVGGVNVNDMAVGQCWDDPPGFGAGATQLLEVPGVPCAEPHHNEVFALVDHPGGDDSPFPGRDQIELDSFRLCLQKFEGYVGVPFTESPLDIFYIYPTDESWLAGDREIVCSLYRLDEARLVGSERGSDLVLTPPAIDPSSAASCVALADLTLELAQWSIDYVDGLSEAEFAALDDLPEEAMPLVKSELLIQARAAEVDCAIADLNALVMAGASGLTAEGDVGQLLLDDIAQSGFFADPGSL
jgi:hypothetical protein